MIKVTAVVALGSAVGAVCRQALRDLGLVLGIEATVWSTFSANASGSLVIGLLAAVTLQSGRMPLGPMPRQFLMAGVCGGFTTFSIFSVESVQLLTDGHQVSAATYMLATLFTCLAACWLGLRVGARPRAS